MTQQYSTEAEAPVSSGRTRRSKKSNVPAFIFLGTVAAIGVFLAVLIIVFDVDSKLDVPLYPGSESATLTDKGLRFIESKYTSDKPSTDYYKVRLTADSCDTILNYYYTEASKRDWTIEKQDTTSVGKVRVDSYSKNDKGLFVYCAPASEQLVQNDGGKNSVILTTADRVLKITI